MFLSPQLALLLPLFIPLIGVMLVETFGKHPNRREAMSIGAGIALFLSVLNLLPLVDQGANIIIAEPLPDVALALKLEPLGLLFALVASALWPITTQYAIGYMRGNNEQNQTRFYMCFAVSISAVMGLALSANMFTLFLFYELLTFATYPLVTHKGDEKAKRGGRIYMGLLLTTSVCFLLFALVWTHSAAGTTQFTSGGILNGKLSDSAMLTLFTLYAFGIGKAALMPFHRWLPNAMVAPTPVSALLHAVAVVKAGVFTMLKVTVYIFGLETLEQTNATDLVLYVATFSLVAASLIALRQDNLKARLAYSTVSQLAYISVAAALATSMSITGGAIQIVMHAFGKITLFFCAGAIYTAAHKTHVSQLDGLGKTMPITFTAFALGAFSIIGLPPFGGSWAKWYLILGSLEADKQFVIVALLLSSLLNIAYLMPVVIRAFFMPAPQNTPSGIQEAPLNCLIPLIITALMTITLFFVITPLVELIAPITGAAR